MNPAAFFSLLTSPPGNLSYHLALALVLSGALSITLYQGQYRDFPQVRRVVWGLSALIALRGLLFLSNLAVLANLVDGHTLLPIADRLVSTLSLLTIVWLWAFPKALERADYATLLIGLLVLAFGGLSLGLWQGNNQDIAFNAFYLDAAWSLIAVLVAGVGLGVILWRKPAQKEIGVLMLGVLAVGHIAHLLAPTPESDLAGFVRAGQLLAYPLLLLLPFRPAEERKVFPALKATDIPIPQERRRFTAAPKTAVALLSLLTPADDICQRLVCAMARTMVADICLLLSPPNEQGEVVIACGFDLIRETMLEGSALGRQELPLIAAALERGRTLRLPGSSTSSDLVNLGTVLGIGHPGPLLLAPIPDTAGHTQAGLVLLSPYARRAWSPTDQEYLEQLLPLLGQVLTQHHQQQTLLTPDATPEPSGQTDAEAREKTAPQEAMLAEIENLYRQIAELQRENRELYEGLVRAEEDAQQTLKQRDTELAQAQAEMSRLQERLATLEQQIKKGPRTASSNSNSLTSEQRELLIAAAQDLRQPMSSIVGYTDLLLGESVGILGALQRKFLERIKASVLRMEGLLDDLIRVAMGADAHTPLRPAPVDLAEVIDQAIQTVQQHLREKNLVLKVDLPEQLPRLFADRDALQQILQYLLTNASLVTPENGEIVLKSNQTQEDGRDFLLIQVTDSGGGIPEADLPRVFARRYRAENPVIEGVGETGVGLSIAKALTEAQQGRIWVESEAGKGATFSIMLPIHQAQPEVNQ